MVARSEFILKKVKSKNRVSVNKMLLEEEKFGIKKFETYKKFGEKVYKIRENVLKNIKRTQKTK